MDKKLKTCLLIIVLITILSITSISCLAGGIFIGRFISEKETSGSDTVTTTETEIVEKPIYINQEGSQRYIDENSPEDVYQQLMEDSNDHFSFAFDVQDETKYEEDKNFILVNLENQYSRVSTIFDQEIDIKIEVKLTDDIDQFETDLNFDYEEDPSFAAFAQGGVLIEIYINPFVTVDKFELASTLSHELVHTYQVYINTYIFSDIPIWYYEGMAEAYAYPNEDVIVHEEIYMNISTVEDLSAKLDSPVAEEYVVGYNGAELFYNYLVEKYGDEKAISLADDVYPKTFDTYFLEVIGITPNQAFTDWLATL